MRAASCTLFVALMVKAFAFPLDSTEEKLASVDEVSVLMYGVLQFSESLHHIYQNTEARLARVMTAIRRTESEMKRLRQDTQEVAETEQQIKEKLQFVQAQMKALQALTQENRGAVARVELDEAQLKKKLTSLEENLNSSVPGKIKDMRLQGSNILKDLMKWTEVQKLKLKNQNQQVVELQKQHVM